MPIVLRDVYAGYTSGMYTIRGVSVEVSSNTVFIGPNGSGKTTLFRTILGLTSVVKGEVLIDGKNVNSIRGEPGLVAVNLPEVILPYSIPARDLAKLYIEITGGDWGEFQELARAFNIDRELDKRFTRLSAGSRVLFLNSLAIASKARYPLLDEPFENVDPARRTVLLKKLLAYRGTVLMNTHTTRLLGYLGKWNATIVVGGKTYGPLGVEDLVSSRTSLEDTGDCVVRVNLDTGGSVCLNKTRVKPVSEPDFLDKLYEVISW